MSGGGSRHEKRPKRARLAFLHAAAHKNRDFSLFTFFFLFFELFFSAKKLERYAKRFKPATTPLLRHLHRQVPYGNRRLRLLRLFSSRANQTRRLQCGIQEIDRLCD
ncbi:hypothetical protein L3Y34_002565 [Caenorhabditis briggsae]|uniref:Uncharacterized protein n=1 Tax=Caenorhabditis briggsae TaxID=6238 RepID=A0AAE9DFS0_CAEBR|nr:hypothetical protein L3Y34_002565 [Caenorhabditis briggsae]